VDLLIVELTKVILSIGNVYHKHCKPDVLTNVDREIFYEQFILCKIAVKIQTGSQMTTSAALKRGGAT